MATSISLYPAETFGERLLESLKSEARRHKQKDLAAAMGASAPFVSQMLNGRRNLTLRTASRLLACIEGLDATARAFNGRDTIADSDGDDGA